MNRIDRLFQHKGSNILSVYYPAGYPKLEDTLPILLELDRSGVDMVEIGMPFSDPVADGPVLEQASQQAIRNGMSIGRLFDQLAGVRSRTDIPLLLMGYLNPVIRYGVTAFCRRCNETGIDGVILPDLPVEEYLARFRGSFEEYGLYNILLMTPQTDRERIGLMEREGKGFLYMVSVASTTGERDGFDAAQIEYFKRVREMKLKLPCLIGFGISDRATYTRACRYAAGAIIGSAFVSRISDPGGFVESIKKG